MSKKSTVDNKLGRNSIGQEPTIARTKFDWEKEFDRAWDEGCGMEISELIKIIKSNSVASCRLYGYGAASDDRGHYEVNFLPNDAPTRNLSVGMILTSEINTAFWRDTQYDFERDHTWRESPFGNHRKDLAPERDVVFWDVISNLKHRYPIDARGVKKLFFVIFKINNPIHHPRGCFIPEVNLITDWQTCQQTLGQLAEHHDRYYDLLKKIFAKETDKFFWKVLNEAKKTDKISIVCPTLDDQRNLLEQYFNGEDLSNDYFTHLDRSFPQLTYTSI